MQFYIVLGDWSDDGHGKSDKVLIESNIPMGDLQQAYKKSCKKTGISFHHDYPGLKAEKITICDRYEEYKLTESMYEILKELECPFDKMEFEIEDDKTIEEEMEEDGYVTFNNESFVNILMWFIGLSVKGNFEWKRVEDKIPCFNGYWQKELNIQLGYGLYQ